MNADLLLTRGDSPKIIIIAISTAGALLLLLNLALVLCYVIRRRKKKCMEEGQLFVCLSAAACLVELSSLFPSTPLSLSASADRDALACACFVFVLALLGSKFGKRALVKCPAV